MLLQPILVRDRPVLSTTVLLYPLKSAMYRLGSHVYCWLFLR